jgi:hypothetical protein
LGGIAKGGYDFSPSKMPKVERIPRSVHLRTLAMCPWIARCVSSMLRMLVGGTMRT